MILSIKTKPISNHIIRQNVGPMLTNKYIFLPLYLYIFILFIILYPSTYFIQKLNSKFH